MNTWFRFYNEALDDPKVQKLSPKLFKYWVNLLCIASKNDGKIPVCSDVAFSLRITVEQCQSVIDELRNRNLIETLETGYVPHSWEQRQFKSDTSRDRTAQWRDRKKRHGDVDVTSLVTPPDTDSEQTQIQNRAEQRKTLAYGEFASVCLTSEEHSKLEGRLNGSLSGIIDELDRYSQTHPKEFKKYRSHYAVILTWAQRKGLIKSEAETKAIHEKEQAEVAEIREIFKNARKARGASA